VLAATVVDSSGFRGTIQAIRDGGAVQVTLDAAAAGTMWFTYSVSDGRGGTDEATVTLTVATGDANTAPAPPTKVPNVTVEQGGFFEYNFLPLWRDGEGDTLFLAGVDDSAGPESIEWRSDGYVRVDASSSTPGVHEYPVTVSDGRDTTTGTMTVTVVAPGAGVIKTNPDVVSTRVGESVLVSPLANDYSPSGKPLRMPSINIAEAGGARVEPNYQAGTFTFTSDRPGTFYVLYAATLDAQSVPGIVRIDVTEAADVTAPPIVVQDTALIPPGEDVLVDVLANDTDPGGGVLVVQSVDVPEGSGLSVAILEHRLLRITNVGGVTTPVSLTYRVSNGPFTATGQVIVIPVQATQHARAPIANDDSGVVRAGDVVTIDVVANDTHPDGTSFALAADALPNLETEADATLGEAFVSDGRVRFAALAGASGTQVLTYQIVDVNGQSASARVSIKVISEDKENSAPRPDSLTARVIAGSAVRIPIPLDGIDPEGDSVTLSGLDAAPDQGRITEVGQDWITYEAYPTAFGADSFTYVVRDTFGAEGVATVRVGIAKPDEENRPPTAAADLISVRPGHSISVPVLSNDTDPEGQPLSLVSDSAIAQGDVTAATSGSRVVVTAGNSEGSASVQYTVADAYGATALGVVQVTVSADAPQIAPIARDDRVTSEEITLSPTMDVPVLINDEDPDGVATDLTIAVDPTLGTVNADKTVTVTPAPAPQRIRYTVTDPDGLTASAYIIVPGAADGRPTLASSKPLEVVSGETLTINLGDVVKTSNGNPAILTSAEAVRAAHTNGAALVINEKTIQYVSADGYYGPDAVTFEVTDGADLNAGGKVSRLSVPITVLPADNVAPTMVGSELKVSDSEAAVSLDLAPLAHDWNPDDQATLEYALAGDASGLDASVAGSVLSVGSGSVKRGGVVKLDVTVSDGKAQLVHATVTVTVVASTRRLAAAVDDVVADANPGQVVTVHPLDNDDNPYVAEREPLHLIAATLEQGAGAVSMSATDATVTVTPTSGTYGTVVVRYVVGDFTGDADRQVEGRIYVTVADKPDAPATPTVVSVESGAVTLEWKAPDNRGAAITKYVVTASNGTSKDTTANTLKFDGLKNGTSYTFTVTAANKKGTSSASAPSAPTTPDQVPNQPEPPTLSFGDHLVHVSWIAPAVDGTPISGYSLSISPGPQTGSSQVKVGVVTSTDIGGLENGVAYAVTVVANNAAGPSAESAYSQPEVPAGAPFAPGTPTTSVPSAVGSRAQISINWSPADGNGDAISTYEVTAYRGGTAAGTVTVGGTSTSAIMELDTNETSYTFAVRGINKTPTPGELSVQSAPRRAVIEPGASTGVTATTPNADNRIVVTYSAGPRNGATAAETGYQYLLNGGGSWAALPGTGVIGPLTSGASYSVQVRAVTTVDGVVYNGAASAASSAAVPFGQIGQAGISATSGSGSVTFHVTAPATNGRPITGIEYCTNAGTGACSNFSNAGFTSGTKDFTVTGLGSGAAGAITIRVTAGTPNTQSVVTGTGNAMTITSTIQKGSVYTGCTSETCWYFSVDLNGAFPTGDYGYKCYTSNGDEAVTPLTSYPGNVEYPTRTMHFVAGARNQTLCWSGSALTKKVQVVGRYLRQARRQHRQGLAGQARRDPACPDGNARRGPRASRRRTGHGQDLDGTRPRGHRRRHHQPHPVHARPVALRRHRSDHLGPAPQQVRVPPGPDLRVDRARGRDQPRLPQDPVGTARGHGGIQGHDRRHHLRCRTPVPGHRHPEPHRTGGHLQAA